THVGITIENSNQINVISEGEAKYRLGKSFKIGGQPVRPVSSQGQAKNGIGSSNQIIIGGLTGKSDPRPTIPPRLSGPSGQNHARPSSNQDIIRAIQRGSVPPITAASSRPMAARPTATLPVRGQPNLLKRVLRLIGLR